MFELAYSRFFESTTTHLLWVMFNGASYWYDDIVCGWKITPYKPDMLLLALRDKDVIEVNLDKDTIPFKLWCDRLKKMGQISCSS